MLPPGGCRTCLEHKHVSVSNRETTIAVRLLKEHIQDTVQQPTCLNIIRLLIKVEHTDSKCDFLKKNSKIYRQILCNVFFKMTRVLPLISAKNCDKNALQNRRGRPILNKIGSLTIVFSVFSFAKICECSQLLPHHIYKSIKDITMNVGSLIANSLIYCIKLF